MHSEEKDVRHDIIFTEKELEALPKALEQEIVMVARREGFDTK